MINQLKEDFNKKVENLKIIIDRAAQVIIIWRVYIWKSKTSKRNLLQKSKALFQLYVNPNLRLQFYAPYPQSQSTYSQPYVNQQIQP